MEESVLFQYWDYCYSCLSNLNYCDQSQIDIDRKNTLLYNIFTPFLQLLFYIFDIMPTKL